MSQEKSEQKPNKKKKSQRTLKEKKQTKKEKAASKRLHRHLEESRKGGLGAFFMGVWRWLRRVSKG